MDDRSLKGLGGWLIVVGIGVVLGPVRLLMEAIPAFAPVFQDGAWEQLTTSGSEYYNPPLAFVIAFELLANTAFLIAGVYLIYLFFARHHRFPTFYIWIYVGSLAFTSVDAIVVNVVVPDQPSLLSDLSYTLFVGLIGGAIWIPYMLYSERVRATFVERNSATADVFA